MLEASPLPRLPVTSLHSIENPQETFHVQLDYQSREEATINGTEGLVTYAAEPPRYPIILMLDGIVGHSPVYTSSNRYLRIKLL